MADTTRGARGMSAGIVRWHVTMSLDGFIAGPDDAMDWVFEHAEPNPAVDDVIRTTGAILAGRRTYDVGRRDVGKRKPSGQAFGGAGTGPQFVLTHDVPDGSDDPSVTSWVGTSRTPSTWRSAPLGGRTFSCSARTWPSSALRPVSSTRCSSMWRRSCWVTASGSSVAPGSGGWTWSRSASSEWGVWRISASASRSPGTRSRR
jgi:dihydrofolate reductase